MRMPGTLHCRRPRRPERPVAPPGSCSIRQSGKRFIVRVTEILREHADAVDPVKRRYLVAFGERRIIEDRIYEIIDRASERQYRLTDVNQFTGAVADNVNTQQFAGLAVEDQLQ